ncbi:MAG: GIY-YIG nuclease family protein [Methanomicrobiales archaeon]|nr:GIY-YIG nuclease family protein [Methanomicrobiales archaeon]
MTEGVYILLFENDECLLRIGALGTLRFAKGWHGYVGSALGPGGFARVQRHVTLYHYHDRPPRWHIDHLLTSPHFHLRYAICGPTQDKLECFLARRICIDGDAGFGASDCRCATHLFHRRHNPLDETRSVFTALGLVPVIKSINTDW